MFNNLKTKIISILLVIFLIFVLIPDELFAIKIDGISTKSLTEKLKNNDETAIDDIDHLLDVASTKENRGTKIGLNSIIIVFEANYTFVKSNLNQENKIVADYIESKIIEIGGKTLLEEKFKSTDSGYQMNKEEFKVYLSSLIPLSITTSYEEKIDTQDNCNQNYGDHTWNYIIGKIKHSGIDELCIKNRRIIETYNISQNLKIEGNILEKAILPTKTESERWIIVDRDFARIKHYYYYDLDILEYEKVENRKFIFDSKISNQNKYWVEKTT